MSFVIQTIVQFLPPLDACAFDHVQLVVQNVDIDAGGYSWVPVCYVSDFGQRNQVWDAFLHGINPDLENPRQLLGDSVNSMSDTTKS